MRVLHTSDWHIGKKLNNEYSRLEEQENFLEDLVETILEEKIDLLIVAGDIFDTVNPSAESQKLLYRYLKRITLSRDIVVVIIAGNHDNGDRLLSLNPLLEENGVIIVSSYLDIIAKVKGDFFEILEIFTGGLKIKINGNIVNIVLMPYPSEKTLNEIIKGDTEKDYQKNYSKKVLSLIKESSINFSDTELNIIIGHFFAMNGKISESEKNIQVGGGYTVNTSLLGSGCDYLALGHLHRSQKVKSLAKKAFYSGSPLQYSKSEVNHKKSMKLFYKNENSEVVVKDIPIKNYKPIKIIKGHNYPDIIDEIKKIAKDDCYIYIETSLESLSQVEVREIKSLHKEIVSIDFIDVKTNERTGKYVNYEEEDIVEVFKKFCNYKKIYEDDETYQKLVDIFIEIAEEGETQ